MAAPTPSTGDDQARRSGVGRILAVVAGLAMVVFWIWILSGAPRRHNPDYLADRGWAARAESTCRATAAELAELPRAEQTPRAGRRADVVDRASGHLEAMVERLGRPLPEGGDDARLARAWLADWRTYLANRRDYTRRLRDDPRAQFLVAEKFRDPIDTVISTFAEVNDMATCAPPGDVG